MSYHVDLSACVRDELEARGLHVGWLDVEHAFAKGDVPSGLTEKLARLSRQRMHETKGIFNCKLCDSEARSLITIVVEGQEIMLGNAEIWVPGPNNTMYVAPNLIVHYIRAHQYLPPSEFLEALEAVAIPTKETWSKRWARALGLR